jgi:hypothetical protein
LSFARYGHHREDGRYRNRDGVEYSRTHRLQPVSPHRYCTEKGNFTESHSSCEKKDWRVASGDQRTCVDRRWFYVVTVKDRRPLPLMHERLDRLGTLGGNRAGREYKYVTALEMFRVFIGCR